MQTYNCKEGRLRLPSHRTSCRNSLLIRALLLKYAALCVVIYALIFALMSVHSSRILHARMLANIMRSPMMFFDTTPIGRILNRFSRDMETVDGLLPFTIRSFLSTFFNVVATVVIITYSTPIFLSVVIPLLVIYYLIQVS